jgi:hypothetical protein
VSGGSSASDTGAGALVGVRETDPVRPGSSSSSASTGEALGAVPTTRIAAAPVGTSPAWERARKAPFGSWRRSVASTSGACGSPGGAGSASGQATRPRASWTLSQRRSFGASLCGFGSGSVVHA